MKKTATDIFTHRLREFLREHQWTIIGLLALTTYALGVIGAATQFALTGERRSLTDPFFRAFQLFVLDDSMITNGPIRSWQLEAARFIAPAISMYAALAALFTVFGEQLTLMRLRFYRNHVVICGLGRKGLAYACDFRQQGDKVVVIERNADNRGIATCRDLGIIVLVGDATEQSVLKKARIAHASHIVAICGDDGTNAEIAIQAHQVVVAKPRHDAASVCCYVHIIDLRLCDLLAHHRVFSDFNDGFDAELFNIYQNSARILFASWPPDRGQVSANSSKTVHLVIIGFGSMGESISLHMARTGHFANNRKPRITIIDTDADARKRVFLGSYPQFAQTCDAAFITADVDDLQMLEKVSVWAKDVESVTSVVVALDDDGRALSCALGVAERLKGLDAPVLVRMSDDAGLGTLLDENSGGLRTIALPRPFGMPTGTCTRTLLLNEDVDRLARVVHEEYVKNRRNEGKAEDSSTVSWDQLDHSLKDSNRWAADHLRTKLRAIGCRGASDGAVAEIVREFSKEEVEILARMEHCRWNAERFLAGWRRGPEDKPANISPYLVDWSDLPDSIKEYDRQAVRQIPRLLELVGEKVHRIKAGTRLV